MARRDNQITTLFGVQVLTAPGTTNTEGQPGLFVFRFAPHIELMGEVDEHGLPENLYAADPTDFARPVCVACGGGTYWQSGKNPPRVTKLTQGFFTVVCSAHAKDPLWVKVAAQAACMILDIVACQKADRRLLGEYLLPSYDEYVVGPGRADYWACPEKNWAAVAVVGFSANQALGFKYQAQKKARVSGLSAMPIKASTGPLKAGETPSLGVGANQPDQGANRPGGGLQQQLDIWGEGGLT